MNPAVRQLLLQRRIVGSPTIMSSNSASINENATLSHVLTANQPVTWSIVGGADQAQFELAGSALRWASNGTKDYETPNDADTNNTYVVTVRATNSLSNTTDQTITVTVLDVDDTAPTITSSASVNADDDAQLAHSLTANETVTWSIVGGADQAQFEISGSTLRWSSNGTRDFQAPADAGGNNVYNVTVRATDTSSNTTDQAIAVTVVDPAAGEWTAAALHALDADEATWTGYTLRQLIPASAIPKDGSAVRLAFRGGSVEGLDIAKVYVGIKGAGSFDFDGNQVPVLFGGSASVSLATNATQMSDTTALDVTTADTIVVTLYISSSADTFRMYAGPGGGFDVMYVSGDSAANTSAGSPEGTIDGLYLEDFEVFGPPLPVNLFPDENVATSANYGTFTNASFANPGIDFNDALSEGEGFRFAGAALTAINALTTGVGYTVKLTFANVTQAGTLSFKLRGGTEVEFAVAGNGVVTHTVTPGSLTSGAGSSVNPASSDSLIGKLTKIEIYAP